MINTTRFWNISLAQKPAAALMAIGTHGPNLVERFRSQQHWWLHLYRYTATLRLDGEELLLRPGYASVIAPGVEIEYDFGERATHLCAHFSLPSGEDLANTVVIPTLQDLGDDFPQIYQSLEEAAGCFAENPLRAEIRLWDILWQLTERARPHGLAQVHAHPSSVQRAREIIELRLSEPLSVQKLAEEVGVSHNHLIRLFHQAVGDTVIGYIRARRVQRARHLLEHTTLPIKAVALQVGMEDTRMFYKLIHAHLGQSPSQVRQKSPLPTIVSEPSNPQ